MKVYQAWKIAVIYQCIWLTTSMHFCFLKNTNTNILDSDNNPNEQKSSQYKNYGTKLRSYHPHYLISLSYPEPMTPHIYYGQVLGDNPIFLYSDVQRWHPQSISTFAVNGYRYTDASAKYFLLRTEQLFKYMLVIQIENSYDRDISYQMKVFKRKDHFFIVCSYQDTTYGFAVYFTKNQDILNLNQLNQNGIKYGIRNQSEFSAKNNWQFSRKVKWTGSQSTKVQNENFTGFALQIQYNDKNILHSIKLNLKENKMKNYQNIKEFLLEQPKAFGKQTTNPNKEVIKYANCAQTAYQKLFDGLSYQYGTLEIRDGPNRIPNQPKPLLSFSPSRKRFPWGFLWDDGFHCEIAVRKNSKLVIQVVKSWLDTMLQNGWIPREQNRGVQRQQLCNCPRFMAKDIRDGNPPTLILSLDYLRRKNLLTKESFPVEYWNKLKNWHKWFMNSQKDSEAYLFKWHDSLNQQGASFTSGLDDFPRPMFSKGHIDLQTWMYFFTKFMVQTAHIYEETSSDYMYILELIKNNFKFFVNPSDFSYRDFSNDSVFSQHFGYPNILPIAFGVPQYKSKQFNATIQKIKQQLDVSYGLASISKLSPLYLSNKDAYWRGPVWININYLFLRGLKLYYPQQAFLYLKLRADLLKTVCGNWQGSGSFYQNYIRGVGSFGYPFNGWTSLIALIQEQNY